MNKLIIYDITETRKLGYQRFIANYYNINDWSVIPDLDGMYLAHADGLIFSLWRGRLIKGSLNRHNGYMEISIKTTSQALTRKVHRLITSAFLPNPENKPQVNHLDFNKLNNKLSNLIWATSKEDATHKVEANRQAKGDSFKSRKRGKGYSAKIVLDTQYGIFYDCVEDAADAIGISRSSLSARLVGTTKNNTNYIYP